MTSELLVCFSGKDELLLGIAHGSCWGRRDHNPPTTPQVGLKIPLIVRLEGTNVAKGKDIIKNSGLAITSADDLDDAAQKAVAALKA